MRGIPYLSKFHPRHSSCRSDVHLHKDYKPNIITRLYPFAHKMHLSFVGGYKHSISIIGKAC